MKKFRASRFGAKVAEVDVERETESSVWIDGSRTSKRSVHENYFDSWEEARDYLLTMAENDLMSARRKLELAQGRVGNIRGMKKPESL
jgi:hypothetical protein